VLALDAGVVGVAAVPAVIRTAAAGIALFAVCGYAPAQRLVRGELAPHRALVVLPLGAALSSMALAILGLLHLPFHVSLPAVLVVALIADAHSIRQHGSLRVRPASGFATRAALPLLLAAVVGLISLIPIFRSGFATVPGQNGDAVLVVGSAVLVEHAPPTANRLDLPINHIPLQWRSKYPIYYALAAVSTLAREDPIRAFATVAALMLALTALGFFLFARYVVRAPPWIALLALFIVPLDRIVMYVAIHPYYNELWGQFTLPFILLFGWRFLVAPDRSSGGLLLVFLILGLLAYPLMVPFPAFFLVAGGLVVWRRGRQAGTTPGWIAALRLPRVRARPLLWIPAAIVGIPVALVLVRGFFEKTLSALSVLAPWTSLANWSGSALGFLPWPHFVGMPGTGWLNYAGLVVVCGLCAFCIYRMHGALRWALGVMVVAATAIAIYFRLRTDGQLFYFKDLAFLGPYVLLLALVALGGLATSATRARAGLGVVGIAAAAALVPVSAAREIDTTFDNATPSILALHSWDRALPRGTSVRIDVPPGGAQLWTTYMFNDHPLSAVNPLKPFFPHPPRGRKADYVIALRTQPTPADAIGAPLFSNAQFELWRMNPAVPGPDISSRQLVDITGIDIGL
jgi:hypothetical protein